MIAATLHHHFSAFMALGIVGGFVFAAAGPGFIAAVLSGRRGR